MCTPRLGLFHAVLLLMLAAVCGPWQAARAQTLSPDFSAASLGSTVLPYAQPGFSYAAQNGVLAIRYQSLLVNPADAGGSVQWAQPLEGDFIFRATVDISGLPLPVGSTFMNAGPLLTFASGGIVSAAPWRQDGGALVNGAYWAPGYVGGTVYVNAPSLAMDIVFERRGNTVTEWAGVAGSGQLQQLLSVSGPEFSGVANSSFFLYVQRPVQQSQAVAAFSNVSVTPVPEPASMLLMALGLAALAARRLLARG